MGCDLILYNGTYLNKGGAAIAYGTLKILRELGLKFKYIVDPDPNFPFKAMGLIPIYRYSDTFSVNPIPSVNPIYTAKPFVRCLANSFSKDLLSFKGVPIWHIGDSPFGDTRSGLSIVGQIFSLSSLKHSLGSRAVVGGVSLAQPVTKIGKLTLPRFFKYDVDYVYTRGSYTNDNLASWGVAKNKYSPICDFAFHLDADDTYSLSPGIRKTFECFSNGGPKIALVLREFKINGSSDEYISKITSFVKDLENAGYDVYYVPTTYAFLIPENDYRYLVDVLHVSQDKIIYIRDNTPGEIISILSNFDCVISTRLHGAILGTLAHVPTIHLYEGGKSLEVLREVYGDLVPMINLYDFTMQYPNLDILSLVGGLLHNSTCLSKNFEDCICQARVSSLRHIESTIHDVLDLSCDFDM